MAKLVGRTKTCIWWVLGAICVAIFGRTTGAEESPGEKVEGRMKPIPVYGTRSQVQPKTDTKENKADEKKSDAEEKKATETKEAASLINEYVDLKADDKDQDKCDEIVTKLKALDEKVFNSAYTKEYGAANGRHSAAQKKAKAAKKSGDKKAAKAASEEAALASSQMRLLVALRWKVVPKPRMTPKYGIRIPG